MQYGKKVIVRSTVAARSLMMAALLMVLLLGGFAQAEEYLSLYSYGQAVSYCSQSPCTGAGNCQENRYPCNGDFPNKYTDTLAGFKDLYNLNDPKILCGQDVLDSSGCAPEEKTLTLSLGTLRQKGLKYVNAFPDAFRVFIPPGAIYGYVNIYMPIDGQEGIVVRFKRPPDGVYCQFAGQPSHYQDVPWDVPNRVNLATLEKRDVYLRNWGGLAAAVTPFSLRIPLSTSGSGWLYIMKLPFTSSRIHKITASFRVNVDVFQRWYDEVEWDAAGDPWSANNNVAPTRVCSSSNLSACLTESACERVGAYWYNDSCNAVAACTGSNLYACNSQAKCASAGFFWYDNQCNSEVACTSADLVACETMSECEGSGFFWYDGSCNAEPRCRLDNLGGCESQNDCTAVGGYWYDGGCNAEAACTTSNLRDCDTELKCDGAGFYWHDGRCSAQSACTQSNLSGCLNRTDCQEKGGVWYTTGGCKVPPRTTTRYSPTAPTSPTTTGTTAGTGGLAALFGLHSAVAAPGTGTTTSTPTPTMPTTTAANQPTVSCDADHPASCDEAECEALGDGYWYDGAVCHEKRETRDYNERIHDAFIRFGDDVDDGDLLNGEKLTIETHFNNHDASVHYAMIVFPGDIYYFIHSDGHGRILSNLPVPVGQAGMLLDKTDICSAVPEYQGEWKIYFLTVPGNKGLDDPDNLAAYLSQDDAQYTFGSYSIHVDCKSRVRKSSASGIASMFMGLGR